MKFETKVIHGGTQGDPVTGAVTTPIYQTSTYHQKELGGGAKYEYTRGENPTRFALESVMADIENGTDGFAFSSGMAAIHATMSLLKAGDHIVMANDVYGGTFRLVNRIMAELGIKFTAVDTADSDALKAAMTPETKMVYLESPSNPLMHVTDIAEASKIAHEGGAIAVVDNTFASPYNQNPLDLGADVVVHSGTKYLGGHADLLSGFVDVKDAKLAESLGGVESLIEVPAVMTHASIPREIRIANGIKDELVRISVGIEDIDDLIADMSKGLDAL